MMGNNNGAIVRRLVRRSLQTNTRRNFFIGAAIALTAFMVASVFSIGFSYIRSVDMMRFRSEGVHSHMALQGATPAEMEALRALPYVRHVGTHHIVGTAVFPNFEQGITISAPDYPIWKYMQLPTFTRLLGHYAQEENEIMLSRAKLEALGFTDPYIGMEIPLTFTIEGTEEQQFKYFYLSAIYTEFVSTHGNAFTPIFVSLAFAERHTRIQPNEMSVNILFRNQARALHYAERLVQDLNIPAEKYALHPGLQIYQDTNLFITYTVISAVSAFLMLTGFLLIYNVMYASVSKDVRFYGLLKTLGTTPRQLRRIVNGQVLLLYIPSVIIGLGVAALASFIIVPMFMMNVPTGPVISFSPVIYAGGSLFALFTAYLGARASAKKAARVSPVEAVRYAGELRVSTKPRASAKGSPLRMAWRNVFRERKRAIVVISSLFMGLTVFTLVMTFAHSVDIEGTINRWHHYDFVLSTAQAGLLDDEFKARVASMPYVTEVHELSMDFAYTPEFLDGPQYRYMGRFIGFDTPWLLAMNPDLANWLDIEAFERGEIALFHTSPWRQQPQSPTLPMYQGKILELLLGNEHLPTTVTIAGEVPYFILIGGQSWWFTGYLDIILSNNYLRTRFEELPTKNLGINHAPNREESVLAALRDALGPLRPFSSRHDMRRAMEDETLMITVMGSGLSGILAIIGIFNFINAMSVGLLVRKREFATLESIGMTHRQLSALVRNEGIIYWTLTIGASLTLGTGIAFGLIQLLIRSGGTPFTQFIYPAVPIFSVYAVIILICTATPVLAYRSMRKASLVERLWEVE